MLTPRYARQFDRDVKRMQRRRKNLEKLKIVIRSLIAGQQLDSIHRDHGLVGTWHGRRECHIESDWLLIYKLDPTQVTFERTGSHSDLFRE
ncbi:MAG: type II toxin-antitoxin system YafQ family toxin [candidate division NC10 bacterium]